MPRAMFKKILACLHPDSRNSVTERRLSECFHVFEQLEILLVPERELSTTHLTPQPPTTPTGAIYTNKQYLTVYTANVV